MNPEKCEVLIAGAGPVGLSLGIECLRHGLAVRLVEKLAQPSDKSKALVIWNATQEVFSRMGVVDAIRTEGVALDAFRICAGKRTLIRIPFSGLLQTSFPKPIILSQNHTERILAERFQALGGRLERAVELLDFEGDETGVTSQLRFANGEVKTLRSDWLVSCEGAHSVARHRLGLAFDGYAMAETFVLADAKITGNLAPREAFAFWSPKGILAIFPLETGDWRVVCNRVSTTSLTASDASRTALDEPKLEEIQRYLDERGPGNLKLSDPKWLACFRINERKARDYGKGRVLLAGDAAHIHSPAGGQGMNTGIQDAFNLGWKLALATRGFANRDLLVESYSHERSEVGDLVLRQAARLTRLALMQNPLKRWLRNQLAGLAGFTSFAPHRMANQFSELNIRYEKSGKNSLTASDDHWHGGSGIAPGSRAKDARWVAGNASNGKESDSRKETSLFHTLDATRFTLLIWSGKRATETDLAQIADLRKEAEREWSRLLKIRLIWNGDSAPDADWLCDESSAVSAIYGVKNSATSAAYLVRPDFYIALRCSPINGEMIFAHLRKFLKIA